MVHDLSLQHCTNIIWAYASISWSTPTLMPALVAGESGLWGGRLGGQGGGRLVWGCPLGLARIWLFGGR